jgi:hypothetical protein
VWHRCDDVDSHATGSGRREEAIKLFFQGRQLVPFKLSWGAAYLVGVPSTRASTAHRFGQSYLQPWAEVANGYRRCHGYQVLNFQSMYYHES